MLLHRIPAALMTTAAAKGKTAAFGFAQQLGVAQAESTQLLARQRIVFSPSV